MYRIDTTIMRKNNKLTKETGHYKTLKLAKEAAVQMVAILKQESSQTSGLEAYYDDNVLNGTVRCGVKRPGFTYEMSIIKL